MCMSDVRPQGAGESVHGEVVSNSLTVGVPRNLQCNCTRLWCEARIARCPPDLNRPLNHPGQPEKMGAYPTVWVVRDVQIEN